MASIQACLTKWASSLIKMPVRTIKQIEDVSFARKLLKNIDDSVNWSNCQTTTSLLMQLGRYYKKQLGLDIIQSINALNIFKNCLQVWQLVIGMAIKGSRREYHINTILQMETDQQDQMMRFISSVFDKLGSQQKSNNTSSIQHQSSTDRDLIIQLSQQNSQLREELESKEEEYETIISNYNSQVKEMQVQIKELRRNQKQFYNVLSEAPSMNIQINGSSSLSPPAEILKEIFIQLQNSQEEIQLLADKVQKLEDSHIQLQKMYENALEVEQNEQGSMNAVKHANNEWEIEKLRKEIQLLGSRQLQLLMKVRQLEDQKHTLKQVVATKIKKQDLSHFQKSQSSFLSPRQNNKKRKNLQIKIPQYKQQYIIQQPQTPLQNKFPKESMRKQLDEVQNPNIRNKLQRQIEYLRQQNQLISAQNSQLRQINKTLQNVITNYTQETEENLKQYQNNYNKIRQQIGEETQQAQKINKFLEECIQTYQQRQNKYIGKISSLELKLKKNKKFGTKQKNKKVIQTKQPQLQIIQIKQNNIQLSDPQNQQTIPLIKINTIENSKCIQQDTAKVQNFQNKQLQIKQQKVVVNLLASFVQGDGEDECEKSVKSSFFRAPSQIIVEIQHKQQKNDQEKSSQQEQSQQSSENHPKLTKQQPKYQAGYQNTHLSSIQKNKQLKDKIANSIKQLQKQSNKRIIEIKSQLKRVGQQHQRIYQMYGNLLNNTLQNSQNNKQDLEKITQNTTIDPGYLSIINNDQQSPQQQIARQKNVILSSPQYMILVNKNKDLEECLVNLMLQKEQTLQFLQNMKESQLRAREDQQKIKNVTQLIYKLRQKASKSEVYDEKSELMKIDIKITEKKNKHLEEKVKMLNQELNILLGVLSEFRQIVNVKPIIQSKKSHIK